MVRSVSAQSAQAVNPVEDAPQAVPATLSDVYAAVPDLFASCSPRTLARLACVSRDLRAVGRDEYVWRQSFATIIRRPIEELPTPNLPMLYALEPRLTPWAALCKGFRMCEEKTRLGRRGVSYPLRDQRLMRATQDYFDTILTGVFARMRTLCRNIRNLTQEQADVMAAAGYDRSALTGIMAFNGAATATGVVGCIHQARIALFGTTWKGCAAGHAAQLAAIPFMTGFFLLGAVGGLGCYIALSDVDRYYNTSDLAARNADYERRLQALRDQVRHDY